MTYWDIYTCVYVYYTVGYVTYLGVTLLYDINIDISFMLFVKYLNFLED